MSDTMLRAGDGPPGLSPGYRTRIIADEPAARSHSAGVGDRRAAHPGDMPRCRVEHSGAPSGETTHVGRQP